MLSKIKDNFINLITSRIFFLFLLMAAISAVMVQRIFDLQIVHGEEYLDTFQLKIKKERTIPAARGNIYDRNGKLLAYNDLSYSVTIEDVFESGSSRNTNLNAVIYHLVQLIERCGDKTVSDFKIILDNDNNYRFTVEDREDKQLKRFLADVYGERNYDDLKYEEMTATAEDVVNYLAGYDRFGIGGYDGEESRNNFVVGKGYTREELLKILTIRFDMNNNSYQKYIATTVSTNVSEETVAVIMENSDILDGVTIIEDTIRKYIDSVYFSQILGYTGKTSQEELESLNLAYPDMQYDMNDTIGKLGIEQSQESILQGRKGHETVFVNNVGKVISSSDYTEPIAGNDVYLTIDKDLQEAAYHILEEKIASILYTKIRNIKEFVPDENTSSSSIVIPIYDVYFALINNNVIDIGHFGSDRAGENEIAVGSTFIEHKASVMELLDNELRETKTPYNALNLEYQVYQSFIADLLYSKGIIMRERVDVQDATYKAWTTEEVISLNEYIHYCISMNWIDITMLELDGQYSDSAEIYEEILRYIADSLSVNTEFDKKIYKYMIKDDRVTGRQLCEILLEQNAIEVEEEEVIQFREGKISPYDFLLTRIAQLDITPAQLALDPYSGSIVITDVHTGEVLALVSYPSYDNNKMANGVDADYYSSLLNDLSKPMFNYATQQKTAPGSTFKMVSATAGMMEGLISPTDTCTCQGIFEAITPSPRCWIYPRGSHGALNVSGGIGNSCNVFFYDLGYRMGVIDNIYSSDEGIAVLNKYSDLYGLSEVSGVEIEEYAPQMSTEDSVRSAIGQGNSNYTTTGLARYVTTIANGGTCYNLTLIDKVTDHNGNILSENNAEVRNEVDLEPDEIQAIRRGMRQVVENKVYFSDLSVNVAGKTGTAQENLNRANHALFVGYAPYENPQIGIATRVAFGYSSDYAAQITREVIKYYYGLAEPEEIITGTAGQLEGGTAITD